MLGSTPASGIGWIQMASACGCPSDDATGGDAGPKSIGSARRLRPFSRSRHTLVAIRYSQVRSDERPSNRSSPRHARTMVSCTASSVSKVEPSIR